MWKTLTIRCFRPDWPLLLALGWGRSVFVWNPQTLSLFLSTSAPTMMITLPRGRHLVKTNNNNAYTKLLVQTNLSDQTGFFFPLTMQTKNLNWMKITPLFMSSSILKCRPTSRLPCQSTFDEVSPSVQPQRLPPAGSPGPAWWGHPSRGLMRWRRTNLQSDHWQDGDCCWPQSTAVLFWLFFLFPFFFSWKTSLPFALCYSISGDGEVVQRWGRRSWLPLHWPGAFLCGVSRFKNFICHVLMLDRQWNDNWHWVCGVLLCPAVQRHTREAI